ncbi:hypothetical protein TB2_031520 [Malus domestica]|uniref:Uncharacterized protein n=1 Tax=Malus domestica TaxID=3750 RepID=A0A498K5F2_MALDO|nr:hypothetical protein DVH24_001127 [Malus domestica]
MYDNGDSFEFPEDSSPDLNSGDDVTPTPIVMVSPPETSDDEDPNCSSTTNNNRASQDVFQTPPEDAHPPTSDGLIPFPEVDQSDDDDNRPYEDAGDGRGVTVPSDDGFTDGTAGGVDLGRDTDLEFSKAETMGIAGFVTELAWERGRFKSPLKKLRVSEHEVGKLEFREVVPHSPGCNSGKSLEIDGGDEKSSEEILEVRKLDSSEDEHESCMEESKSHSEEEEGIQDILKRTPNVTIEELRRIERLWLQRVLPRSIGGQAGSSANGAKEGKPEEVAILDVLKLLKDKYDGNGNGNGNDEIDKSSFLEISKRRGMTFPRPSWWPEGGF